MSVIIYDGTNLTSQISKPINLLPRLKDSNTTIYGNPFSTYGVITVSSATSGYDGYRAFQDDFNYPWISLFKESNAYFQFECSQNQKLFTKRISAIIINRSSDLPLTVSFSIKSGDSWITIGSLSLVISSGQQKYVSFNIDTNIYPYITGFKIQKTGGEDFTLVISNVCAEPY